MTFALKFVYEICEHLFSVSQTHEHVQSSPYSFKYIYINMPKEKLLYDYHKYYNNKI